MSYHDEKRTCQFLKIHKNSLTSTIVIKTRLGNYSISLRGFRLMLFKN